MTSFNRHPSSYRDPSGFLFYHHYTLYRQINTVYKEHFNQLIESGLYNQLAEKKILIPHQTVNQNLTGTKDWYQTLLPDFIPFISYPYEWCFDMWKDAALITIEAAKEAMNFGMILKDASAYNVQLHKGRMIFIDTLSFEKYDEQKPWMAYRQFCGHFFAPLALMHYLQEPLQNLFLGYPDGIPIILAKKMLPFKSKLHLHTNLNIHLHSSASKHSDQSKKENTFSKQKMKNLLRSLEEGIQSFSFAKPSGVWSNYYDEANLRGEYLAIKKQIVDDWLMQLQPKIVFDAGANEGTFSELAAQKCDDVISADLDHDSINSLYKKIRKKNITNLHPLLLDLSNPSPAIGVNNEERASFLQRTKVDTTLALALVHHLAIGKNIPFESMAKMFSCLGRYLIIEFVPKADEKIQSLLQQKKDIYHWYNEENFIAFFSSFFKITATKEIGYSKRTLFLMEAYDE